MVIAAVRGVLENEPYKSRFTFLQYEMPTKQGQLAREMYPFGRERHGFLVIAHDGTLLKCRPGHFYDEMDIQEDLDAVLANPVPLKVD